MVKGLGVPIVTKETTREDAKNNPRVTVEENYKMIFDDLDRAEELLKEANVTDKSQITLPVVYGLKARAYLERGTAGVPGAFEQAEYYARLAITASGCTPLTRDQWEDPINGFNSMTSNNSWMWGASQSSEEVHNLRSFVAHMSTEESWTSYGWRVGRGINKLLYDQIPDNDFRKYSWLDPDRNKYDYKSCRPDGKKHFANNLKDYANIKFRPAQGAYSTYKIGNASDLLFMRVEEMYFIEAEAVANLDLEKGKKLLNDFMKYRITDGSYDCSSLSSIAEFNEEIILQKRIEFWGEGIIFFDMKRHGVSTSRGYVGTNSPTNYRLTLMG